MQNSSPPPNIVLIVSDDHGYGDFSHLGHDPSVSTPALDQLVVDGVTCTQAYVTAPICSPSRAGLISGQYQQRWGALWFDSSGFPDAGQSTMAEVLRDRGYTTGYFGKVHYGKETVGDRGCPPHHGFDTSFYGLAGQHLGRLHYLSHTRDAAATLGSDAAWRMGVAPMLDGDQEVEFEGFLTEELGRRARQFVVDNAERPFFAMVAFNAVHNFCWQLPSDELVNRGLPGFDDFGGESDDYLDWYRGAISPRLEHGREYYVAQLELMDREIGRLRQTLDDLGVAENTIVVYLTDNGGSPCNFGDNTPLRGSKYTLWEGGIRVPTIAHWPLGGWTGSRQVDHLVSSLDLFPTLASAAGVDSEVLAPCDGIDLGPSLADSTQPPVGTAAQRRLHWDTGFQWAIRRGDWKLRWVDPDCPQRRGVEGVNHADLGSGWFLADLAADPSETTNLIDQHPDLASELYDTHQRWRREVGIEDS